MFGLAMAHEQRSVWLLGLALVAFVMLPVWLLGVWIGVDARSGTSIEMACSRLGLIVLVTKGSDLLELESSGYAVAESVVLFVE